MFRETRMHGQNHLVKCGGFVIVVFVVAAAGSCLWPSSAGNAGLPGVEGTLGLPFTPNPRITGLANAPISFRSRERPQYLDSLLGQAQMRPSTRSRLSNRQKRNIKHPDNILRKEAAESAVLGNRIGLEKQRAMRTDFCSLCATVEGQMTFHHLIPRATHGKRWCMLRFTREERNSGVCLCRDCHDQVHKNIKEKDLALRYNTIDRLQGHPELRNFVDDKAPWSWLSAPRVHVEETEDLATVKSRNGRRRA